MCEPPGISVDARRLLNLTVARCHSSSVADSVRARTWPTRSSTAGVAAVLATGPKDGALSTNVPAELTELITLGRTLKRRAAGVLAYFERPGTRNGPTDAINGRLEHLRGGALGFRNITNYIASSLLETGGFTTRLHPAL